jgi:hypothetical protein
MLSIGTIVLGVEDTTSTATSPASPSPRRPASARSRAAFEKGLFPTLLEAYFNEGLDVPRAATFWTEALATCPRTTSRSAGR